MLVVLDVGNKSISDDSSSNSFGALRKDCARFFAARLSLIS